MFRFTQTSTALLVVALLAGCGTHLTPVAAQSVVASSLAAKAVVSVDPQVQKLIVNYQAITGYTDDAMTQRDTIVGQLGDTDSDLAASFIETQYEHLSDFPDAVRPDYENKLVDALLSLDTYDAEQDDEAITSGPGDTLVSMETYFDASLRKTRHGGFVHWVTSPFRWVGNGIKRFWSGLTGHHTSSRSGGSHRRPSPGNGGYPNGGGIGGQYPGGNSGQYPGGPTNSQYPY